MIYGELKISMEINEYIKQYKEKGGYIKALREHIGHAPIITIGVGVIVENSDGEILLQKRKDNGKWAIIGGGMEIGESFEEVIRREAREETGIELGELRLLAFLLLIPMVTLSIPHLLCLRQIRFLEKSVTIQTKQ